MQALIARGVIGDFRAGDARPAAGPPQGGRRPSWPGAGAKRLGGHSRDILRFGFTPLYTRFVDVWDAVEQLRQVMRERRVARGALQPARRGDLKEQP